MPSSGRTTPTDLLRHEKLAWSQGLRRVAGVDEVGRGPLAGPVVAAAVVLPPEGLPAGLDDSKALSAKERERLARELKQLPTVEVALALRSPAEIDDLNILRCTHATMREALEQIQPPPDFALVDGLPVPGLPVPSKALVKGDSLSASIAAASIIAKVYRDRLMVEAARRYPGYGFENHKGYCTREHVASLRELGPSPIHRKSFRPVALLAPGAWQQPELDLTTAQGT